MGHPYFLNSLLSSFHHINLDAVALHSRSFDHDSVFYSLNKQQLQLAANLYVGICGHCLPTRIHYMDLSLSLR